MNQDEKLGEDKNLPEDMQIESEKSNGKNGNELKKSADKASVDSKIMKADKFKTFTIPSIISIVWGGYITVVVFLSNLYTSNVIGKYNNEVLEVIRKSDPNMRIEDLTGEVKSVYITYLNELNLYRIMLFVILFMFSILIFMGLSNYYDKKLEKISKGK